MLFSAKGLSVVTLSGAHSIGCARCRFFLGRFAGQIELPMTS
jgi:hypothetical protein